MTSEGLEEDEWDQDLIDELVQAEEKALSMQRHAHRQHHTPPSAPAPPPIDVSYSPPRELSQRPREASKVSAVVERFDSSAPAANSCGKEVEIDRLKVRGYVNEYLCVIRFVRVVVVVLQNELGRVSKQLNLLEKECSELRKERGKKEEQLKVIHPERGAKDAELERARSSESDRLVSCPSDPGTSHAYENANSSCKPFGSWTKSYNTVGVQTDKVTEFGFRGSQKLLDLWNSSDRNLGQRLVEKLFTACETDFHVLFGFLNSSFPDQANMRPTQGGSGNALSDQLHPTQPIESVKVAYLYTVMMKVSDETASLTELLEALFDLCSLKNVVIVHRSLRVVHVVLTNSFSMEKKLDKRENVMVEEPSSSIPEASGYGYSEYGTLLFANLEETLKQGNNSNELSLTNVKIPKLSGFLDRCFAASISITYWVALFEQTCQIAVKHKVEEIRRELLSIMNLILMRQNAYLERDKFAGKLLFRSLPQLLRREAGFYVPDLAVHMLYLLCNYIIKNFDDPWLWRELLTRNEKERTGSSAMSHKYYLQLGE